MSIGNKIRQRRKELGLTQAELGRRVHKSSQVISNWERGYTTGIAADDLQQLSAALDTGMQFFVPAAQSALGPMATERPGFGYVRESPADSRLESLIAAYPHLDEKSKDIIEAIVRLSDSNECKQKA